MTALSLDNQPEFIQCINTHKSWEIRIADKSIGCIKEKCKAITNHSKGVSEKTRIVQLQSVITGRMCQWKAWNYPKTRVKELFKLGFSEDWVYKCAIAAMDISV